MNISWHLQLSMYVIECKNPSHPQKGLKSLCEKMQKSTPNGGMESIFHGISTYYISRTVVKFLPHSK